MTRTWWAAAALLAIFAMHGLATHASAAGPAALPAPAAEETSATQAAHGAHSSHAPVADDEVLTEAAAWSATSHGDGHQAMQVLGLCLAVLATAAIALLRAARTPPGLVALLPRPRAGRTPPAAARHDLGPPDLHSLSILRC